MPGMDGLALLAALHARGVSVPTVMVTASPDDDVVRMAEALGALGVLAKPYDVDERCRSSSRPSRRERAAPGRVRPA